VKDQPHIEGLFQTFGDRPFTIDRNPGDRFALPSGDLPGTELPNGAGSNYSKAPKLFHLAGSGTDFFANKMIGEGFVVRKDEQLGQSDFYGANTPGYINFNSMQLPKIHIGISYIPNVNATGFTTKRTENDLGPAGGGFVKVEPGGTAGEYIIGSGLLDRDGSPISGPTNFFPNSFGVGFVKNAQDLYNANEINPAGGAGRSMFNLETVVENPGSADGAQENFQLAIGNVRTARTSVEEQTHGTRKLARSSSPNIPFSYHFGPEHPYGEIVMDSSENGKALIDRKDLHDQYTKFGGNRTDDHAGLRATSQNEGHPSHGGYGAAIGTDQPYILKSIPRDEKRAKYYTGASSLDEGIMRGGVLLNASRTADDLLRLGMWTFTARGIIWNAKQLLLQAQSATGKSRLFNPLGIFGSVVPGVHLPRHTIGTFTDFKSPPEYDTAPDGFNVTTVDGAGNEGAPEAVVMPEDPIGAAKFIADQTKAKVDKLKKKIESAKALIAGEPITNRLEALHATRIEKGGEDVEPNEAGFSEALGLGNKHFINPHHVVKSTRAPYGGEIKNVFKSQLETKLTGNTLISNYAELETFDGGATDGAVKSSDVSSKAATVNGDKIGTTKVRTSNGIYSVGVSNQLQVPYHGQFNKLNSSLADLPKDFIKFRIREAVNGKWLIFPAHLGTITDTATPEWTKERYIGRPDQTHIYSGASRNVSFDFKVAAFTKQEIPIIQEKMNYLMGLAWPTYKTDETPVSPYVYLTIGDLFNNTPGYFESIAITIEENATWEIDDEHQIPTFFNVSLTFVHVGKYLPTTTGKHYEVPWLKDHGAGASSHGTFDKDPRDGSTSRPFMKGSPKWASGLE